MYSDWDFRQQFHLGHIFHHVPSGSHLGPQFDLNAISQPVVVPPLDRLFNGKAPPTVALCNPMPAYQVPVPKVDEVDPGKARLYVAERPKLTVVRRSSLDAYAAELVRIGKELQSVGYHGVVVPLRGGLKPWVQLDVVTELKLHDCWLPFTQGANGVDRDQIRHYLASFLSARPPVTPFRLAVVDTANSGHSSCMLADVIKSVWSDRGDASEWAVDFYLLFEATSTARRQPPKSRDIGPKSNTRLQFRVFPRPVPDLVVEDWDEALGVKCLWRDGTTPALEVIPSKGVLAIQERDGRLHIIEADRLDRETDLLLGEAVSEAVVTEPGFEHTHDVWPAYLPEDGTPPTPRTAE